SPTPRTTLFPYTTLFRSYDGFCPTEIKNEATKNNYSIYFLTYVDTPWEADDLRDRPENREEMFRIFEAELKKQGFPYKILKGNEDRKSTRLNSSHVKISY